MLPPYRLYIPEFPPTAAAIALLFLVLCAVPYLDEARFDLRVGYELKLTRLLSPVGV
jgi:hypothetical protein